MNNEERILAEAESIINASVERAETAHKAKQLEHFVRIESEMFKEFPFDDELAHLFHMTMVATTPDEVRELQAKRKASKRTQIIPPDDPTEEPNRAMAVELVCTSGDVYEMLRNKRASLTFANSDRSIGCIVRVAAFQSASAEKEGVKPSEATDKQDAIITIMMTDERIMTISRLSTDKGEIHTMETELEDFEPDKEKLLDAIFAYYIFPQMMKHQEPEMFEALLKDYADQAEKEEE